MNILGNMDALLGKFLKKIHKIKKFQKLDQTFRKNLQNHDIKLKDHKKKLNHQKNILKSVLETRANTLSQNYK